MARNHARVHVGIWQDPDFLALDVDCQRLYLFLLSQPNLTHLGVLPLTLRRWAQKARDLSVEQVTVGLAELDATRFVVVDGEAEELLIRTLLRGDGIYKQPNVMRGAIASAPAVHSVRIKRKLLAEIDQIDLTEVTEDKGRRDEARTLLDTLRDALAIPSGTPDGTPAETPSEGFGEPQAIPPTHTRAQPLVLSPSTYPLLENPSSPLRGEATPPGFEAFWDEYPRRVGKQDAIKAYRKALKKTDAPTLLAGALAYANDPNREQEFTAHPATWLNRGGWEDDPLPARGSTLRSVPSRAIEGDHRLQAWYEAAINNGGFPELGAG